MVLVFLFINQGKKGFNPEGPKKIIIEKLQLDDQQVISYQKLIDQHRIDIKAKDEKILFLKNELYSTLNSNQPTSVIDSLTSEIGIIQKQIEMTHYNHFLDIKSLCNSEQLPLFNDLSNELSEIFNHKKKPK